MRRLSEIGAELGEFALSHDVRFSLYKVAKRDHAVITFFDQVFDAGLNDAVPWHHYWTPLRYILVFKVAALFEETTAKAAWKARQETNPAKAADALRQLCGALQLRLHLLPDSRSREIIGGALKWAATHPHEIGYGAGNYDSALHISPNLVGFQQVLQNIGLQARKQSRPVRRITVDRQTQFNHAQTELSELYRRLRGHKQSMGPGMPEMDMTHIPDIPLMFQSSDKSSGLELVDVALWVAKRHLEDKVTSRPLEKMLHAFTKRGTTDEVSLRALERRWAFLADLPDPDGPLPRGIAERISQWEDERRKAVADCEPTDKEPSHASLS